MPDNKKNPLSKLSRASQLPTHDFDKQKSVDKPATKDVTLSDNTASSSMSPLVPTMAKYKELSISSITRTTFGIGKERHSYLKMMTALNIEGFNNVNEIIDKALEHYIEHLENQKGKA